MLLTPPVPELENLERVDEQVRDIISGRAKATTVPITLKDGAPALAALYVEHGFDIDDETSSLFTDVRIVGVAACFVATIDPYVGETRMLPTAFIEQHGQEATPGPPTHSHTPGACWGFRYGYNAKSLFGDIGLARYSPAAELARYITRLLDDTLLRGHMAAADPLRPGTHASDPIIRRLKMFMSGDGAFEHPALTGAARFAIQQAEAVREVRRPLPLGGEANPL